MNKTLVKRTYLVFALAMAFLILGTATAEAVIDGITVTGPVALTAKEDFIVTADGGAVLVWGYANGTGRAQYPGPTLIVNEGQMVTINLTNQLSVPVSIVFPGLQVTASGGTCPTPSDCLLIRESTGPADTVTYTFTASKPGTYLYHSGTRPDLQAEMGLVGAIIVRPTGFNPLAPTAYGHAGSAYDREYLFVLSEMDSRIHDVIEFLGIDGLAWFDFLSSPFPN